LGSGSITGGHWQKRQRTTEATEGTEEQRRWRQEDEALVADLQREVDDLNELLGENGGAEKGVGWGLKTAGGEDEQQEVLFQVLRERRSEAQLQIQRIDQRISLSLAAPPPPPPPPPPRPPAEDTSPLATMMRVLAEEGLHADPVAPHKDSFFLALVKSLNGAGLRPRGYLREQDGSFGMASRRAKLQIMRKLSAGAGRLNNKIGGWPLSPSGE